MNRGEKTEISSSVSRAVGGDLTGFEGGLDGIWVELTEVRLEHGCILVEYWRPWLYEGVQSVEEDEPYRDLHRLCKLDRVTKGMIINSGRRVSSCEREVGC